jgi:hypothetical protein
MDEPKAWRRQDCRCGNEVPFRTKCWEATCAGTRVGHATLPRKYRRLIGLFLFGEILDARSGRWDLGGGRWPIEMGSERPETETRLCRSALDPPPAPQHALHFAHPTNSRQHPSWGPCVNGPVHLWNTDNAMSKASRLFNHGDRSVRAAGECRLRCTSGEADVSILPWSGSWNKNERGKELCIRVRDAWTTDTEPRATRRYRWCFPAKHG